MIPVLFAKGATDFSSNGLGKLTDTVSAKVRQERNGKLELTIKYPAGGVHFDEIGHSCVVTAPPEDGKDPEPFRIYSISKPIDGMCTIKAEHISYQLSYIPVTPFGPVSSIAQAMIGLKANAAEACPFEFWTDKQSAGSFEVTEPKSIRSCLGGTQGSILDAFGGGEYEFTGYTVKLYQHRGHDNGVVIRYGKNLTSLEQEEEIDATITGVYPFWKGRTEVEGVETDIMVTLTEKVLHSENAANFPYQRTVSLDCSQHFQTQPTEAQLRAYAQAYIEEEGVGVPKVSWKISFVPLWQSEEYKEIANLERVRLCDTVTVRFSALGVDATAKVIATDYDVLHERYDSIELGDARKTFAGTVKTELQAVEKTAKQNVQTAESRLREAIETNTETITGGLGGHVVLKLDSEGKPEEILIMDTDDIQTAVNVWRFNLGGLGHSHSGYDGPFNDVALTMDGKINASLITTGTLVATLIKAGVLSDEAGKNYWNMETGDFRLSPGTSVGNASQSRTMQNIIDGVDATITDVDVEFAQNQSNTQAPTSGWSTSAPTWREGWYIWQRTKTTTAAGADYSQPTCISGREGVDGTDGHDGAPGADGHDGAPGADGVGVDSVEIKYGMSDGATTQPAAWYDLLTPEKGKWLWIRTVTTYTDNSEKTTYSKSYTGTDGEDGRSVSIQSASKTGDTTTVVIIDSDGSTKTLTIKDGQDGTDGSPGAYGYVHIAWATSADGSQGFSTTVSAGKTYLGSYTDNEATDSTDYRSYSWAKIKGENGADGTDGDDGIGVSAIVEQYYLSTSNSSQTGGSWSADQPVWSSGKYIWTRSHITWTDGTETNTSPVLAKAINGANQSAKDAGDAVTTLNNNLTQQEIFNRLTNNGEQQGIYMQNGKLYLNFAYAVGQLLKLGGANNANGTLEVYNASNVKIGKWDKDGIEASGDFTMTNGTRFANMAYITHRAVSWKNTGWEAGTKNTYGLKIGTTLGTSEYDLLIDENDYMSALEFKRVSFFYGTSGGKNVQWNYNVGGGDTHGVIEEVDYTNNETDYINFYRWGKGRTFMGLTPGSSGDESADRYAFGFGISGMFFSHNTKMFSAETCMFFLTDSKFAIRLNDQASANAFQYDGAIVKAAGKQLAFVSSSSRRYKHDIMPIRDKELDPHKLLELEVVQFTWNEDHPLQYADMFGKTVPGLIAEDVAEIYPAAAIADPETGEVESWDERRIIPGMLALIQEQAKKIEELEKRVAALERWQ